LGKPENSLFMRSITSKLLIPFLVVLSSGILNAQRTQGRVSFEALAQNYFPLAVGNSWTYVVTGFAAQGSVTVRVSRAVDINGGQYYELLGYTPEPALVRLTRSGQLVEQKAERWFDQELLWYDFAAPEGVGWESGVSGECNGRASKAAPPESVRVPAGSFDSLVRIAYQGTNCADAGLEEEIFAAGIGLIRRTSSTIGGPRSIELVSAEIGGTHISAKGLTVSPFGETCLPPISADTNSIERGPPIVIFVRRMRPTPAAKISSSSPASAQLVP
jgi:hypothetical protein